MDKKKKPFKRDKWPYQNRATPIGSPPKGMWYNPQVKDADEKKPSLRDALHHFTQHPDSLGKPGHVSMTDSKIEFASGQILSFKEVIQRYIETTQSKDSDKRKGVEKGFYDSPVDVGKDPKGDFPSNNWLPKGTEDMSVSPNEHAASLSKIAYISGRRGNAYVRQYLEEFDIEYDDTIQDILKSTAWDVEKKIELIHARVKNLAENWSDEDDLDVKSVDWSDPEINDQEIMNLINSYEDLHTAGLGLSKLDKRSDFWPALGGQDVKHEDHMDTYEGHDTEDGSKWFECPKGSGNSRWEKGPKSQKKAEDSFITEESKEAIAKTHGAEYISALKHYVDAVQNGHPEDLAMDYAVAEMNKQSIGISPTKLLEVISLYLI